MNDLRTTLKRMGACPEAVSWVAERDLATAWAECENGSWMLWFAARRKVDRKALVRAACYCAREALKYVQAGDDRPWYAIETALAWCDGRATLHEVRDAAYAYAYAAYADAYAAYAAAAYAAATYAAYAAAYADDAYAAATYAADAYAAYADAYAAYADAAYADAAYADARTARLKRSAEIVRSVITVEMLEKGA